MNNLLSDTFKGLKPYVPGEQPTEPIQHKLNTNENPYPPSPMVIEAIRNTVDQRLRLYPDYTANDLRNAIAQHHGVTAEQVFIGNGSDEVLAHIFKAFFQRDGVLLMPDISYSFYTTYAAMYGVREKQIALNNDFSLPVDKFSEHDPNVIGVIFANPNAPTGLAISLEEVSGIAKAHPNSAVVVDEAYVDFGADSAIKLINKHKNIVVVHTLSKSRALAGLRVGYAIACEALVKALNVVKDSFNSYPLDTLAMAGATASFKDDEYFTKSLKKVIKSRSYLSEKLQSLGFEVLPSKTNFLFVKHSNYNATDISAQLRRSGILVRHFNSPRINQFLRITIGTQEQCEFLYEKLQGILK